MQHPTFSATLAEQHRDELGRQAKKTRLAGGSRPGPEPPVVTATPMGVAVVSTRPRVGSDLVMDATR
jgi:hypothetical protein